MTKCMADKARGVNKVHDLKTWPEYFEAVKSGAKRFEIRRNDRAFLVGDVLHLIEFDAATSSPTPRCVLVRVTYITDFNQQPGNVVMSIEEYKP